MISLDGMQAGQIWALVGESDSGNSALLASMDVSDTQRVVFKHPFRNLSHTTDFYYQQRFNSTDACDSPTVREHLEAIAGKKGRWTMDKIVDRFHLHRLLDEQLIKLSNGETRRLLIAAALLKDPAILLLDHPLTGFDVQTREAFNGLLLDIADSGIIAVIACSVADLPQVATHVVVLHQQQVTWQGSTHLFDPSSVQPHSPTIQKEALMRLLSMSQHDRFEVVVSMVNVTIRYDDKIILDNINWIVRQGERWSLSGPNGAGKSTLLSLINGDNPQAYANRIVLFDRQRGTGESIWDIKRQTGFVSPELYQYFPTDISCAQVIESGFYDTIGLFKLSDAVKSGVCLEWMQLMHIEKYVPVLFGRAPAAVQRLCLLARALVKNPPLLILDEPTQGLDSSQQRFFTALINEICLRSTVTLIYVSHYAQHIPEAVTRHIRLENGRVTELT